VQHESVRYGPLLSLILLVMAAPVYGDGSAIDKVYHPYVQALEREVELRASIEDGSNAQSDERQTWRLGFGHALGESWFGEAYLIGEERTDEDLDLKGYELEALWQLVEAGEYAVDSGLLFEFEHLDKDEIMEFSLALLLEKAWGRWSATANLAGAYEFGSGVDNEFETAAAMQLRYRHARHLEPALEFYASEDTRGLGPVLLGDIRYGPGRQLHWEAGMIIGVTDETPDRTFRLALEYEF
jgi:hypothetical protein